MVKKTPVNKKKSQEKTPKQLSLGLNSPVSNIFTNLKWRVTSRLNLFEANTFINDPIVWFFAVIQLVAIFYQLIYILNGLPKLPSVLPLFDYASTTSTFLIPKLYFGLLPIAGFFVFAYTFRLSRSYYFRNSLLAHYILFISSLSIIVMCLHLIKIFSQYV